MNDQHEYLDLATGYVLGNLDDVEERRFLEHLAAGCPLCEPVVAGAESVRRVLAESAPPIAPSPELRGRVLDAVAKEPPPGRAQLGPSNPATPRKWQRWAWAALFVLVVFPLALQVTRLTQRERRLRADLAALRDEIEAQRERTSQALAAREQELELLRDPVAECYEFAPQPDAAAGLGGKAIYSPASRRAVIALDNATVTTQQDYELWGIRDGTPVSLGVLPRDPQGRPTLFVADVGTATGLSAFAISVEPAGGSPQPTPTGPVVLVCPLGG